MEIRYGRRRSKTKKNGVGIKSGTIFGSIFPDFGGSTLAISVAQFTPMQLALSDRRIHSLLSLILRLSNKSVKLSTFIKTIKTIEIIEI